MSYNLFDKSNLTTLEGTLTELRIWCNFNKEQWDFVSKEIQSRLIIYHWVEENASGFGGYKLSKFGRDKANELIATQWVVAELERRNSL